MDYSLLVGIRGGPYAAQHSHGGGEGGIELAAVGGEGEGGDEHGGARPYASGDGATFYFGVIDVLEAWRPAEAMCSCKWPVQSCLLKAVFRYLCCMQWCAQRGRSNTTLSSRPTPRAFLALLL